MKAKLKHKQVVSIYKALLDLPGSENGDHETKYNLLLAVSKLKPYAEALEKSQSPSKEHKEYVDKYRALYQEYAVLGPNKRPKIENGDVLIKPEKKEEFDLKEVALKEEYKDAIVIEEQRIKDFPSFMEQEQNDEIIFPDIKMDKVCKSFTKLPSKTIIELFPILNTEESKNDKIKKA